jgi:rhodanese-related sulfurtransferase
MPDLLAAGAFRACALGLLSLFAAASAAANPIGPEAVRELQADASGAHRVEIVSIGEFLDPGRPIVQADRFAPDVNVIYACWSLSKRRCREEVLRGRAQGREKVFYLTGTPQEWVATKVAFPDAPQAALDARMQALTRISVRDLASARQDGTEFTLLDLRRGVRDEDARIDGAILVPPALLREKLELLPKRGWIVLYDGGDGSADAYAVELRMAGFPMAVVLDGGYPAWVTSEQR